jgi:uncharacterized protein involved in exopolysaccharide biosynthesis
VAEDLDLRAIGARLALGRWTILASVLLFTVLFAVAAFVMTPMYRATAVLAPANLDRRATGTSRLGALSALTSLTGLDKAADDGDTQEALAVLRSREFTEAFLAEQHLLPELYASRWDATRGRWKVDASRVPTIARALKYFNRLKAVTEDRQTGLYYVEIEWRDPARAAAWANGLVERLNAVMRRRAIERSTASLQYLQKELAVTQTLETRNAISNLVESQINERMLANVTPEYAFRVVDRALVPDARDPVRPRKALLVMLGALTGVFVGMAAVFMSGPRAVVAPT